MAIASSSDIVRACSHCHEGSETLKFCARCGIVEYCSRECQRAAWPRHREYCIPRSAQRAPVAVMMRQNAALDDLIRLYRVHQELVEHVCAMAFIFAARNQFTIVRVPAERDPTTGDIEVDVIPHTPTDPNGQRLINEFLSEVTDLPLIVERPDVGTPGSARFEHGKVASFHLPDEWSNKTPVARLLIFAQLAQCLTRAVYGPDTKKSCTTIASASLILHRNGKTPTIHAIVLNK